MLQTSSKDKWQQGNISIQDLKAYYRAEKYLRYILNTLEIPVDPILMHQDFADVFTIGAINRNNLSKMVA
ncbi:MAG: hypothetical protein AAF847_16945 [Bacteroidota bacterium]